MQNNILMPGDAAGNYDEKWTKTFDLKFLILWLILFVLLLSWTLIFDPNLFDAGVLVCNDTISSDYDIIRSLCSSLNGYADNDADRLLVVVWNLCYILTTFKGLFST
jgi:hypothetical protein